MAKTETVDTFTDTYRILVMLSSCNDGDAGYHYRPLVAMARSIDISTDLRDVV